MSEGIALTIGLNRVDPKHYYGWTGNLNACEADAIDMADIAKSKKFSTKILITEEATRSNVIDEILRASQYLKTGDIFMMACSCYGGQLPDVNNLSVSGLLDTWCLYDGQLIKNEIHSLLTKFQKGVRILIFSDSCHSGSVVKLAYYRGTGEVQNANISVDPVKYRFMSPEVALRTYRQNQGFYKEIINDPELKNASGAIKASVLWILGCQDNQILMDGDFNGVFTAHILKVWKNGRLRVTTQIFTSHLSDKCLLTRPLTSFIWELSIKNSKPRDHSQFRSCTCLIPVISRGFPHSACVV